MNWKALMVPLIIVLVISLCANFYSFKKLSSRPNEEQTLLEKRDQEIEELKSTIAALEANTHASTYENNDNIQTTTTLPEVTQNSSEYSDLINTTKRYLEYAFNVNPDNYVTAKNNAHNYMTDEMIDIIFVSDGVDRDFYMQINNIKVYTTDGTNKEVVAYYESEIETYDTKYVEKNYNYVLLKFIEEEGKLKISSLTPIKITGAN